MQAFASNRAGDSASPRISVVGRCPVRVYLRGGLRPLVRPCGFRGTWGQTVQGRDKKVEFVAENWSHHDHEDCGEGDGQDYVGDERADVLVLGCKCCAAISMRLGLDCYVVLIIRRICS